MRSAGKSNIFITLVVGFFGLIILALYLNSIGAFSRVTTNDTSSTTPIIQATSTAQVPKIITIQLPKGPVEIEVAETVELMKLGLGNRTSLDANKGMLFVFPKADTYGFWMKDMRISIDIIWIDGNGKVVGITRNISPLTYPESFFPPSPINFALELNAGGAEKFAVATGTMLSF